MVMLTSVPPSGATGGSVSNAASPVVAQAMGAANSGPAAQQLLQTAVIATALVPQYADQPKPQAAKTPPRSGTGQPSSALAAQFLAQTPEADTETVAIFNPRPQAASVSQSETDAVGQWQGSGGAQTAEEAPPLMTAALATAQAALVAKSPLAVSNMTLAHLASDMGQPAERAQKQIILQQAIGGKKGGIVLSRGANAYAQTAERNTTAFIRVYVEAVS